MLKRKYANEKIFVETLSDEVIGEMLKAYLTALKPFEGFTVQYGDSSDLNTLFDTNAMLGSKEGDKGILIYGCKEINKFHTIDLQREIEKIRKEGTFVFSINFLENLIVNYKYLNRKYVEEYGLVAV